MQAQQRRFLNVIGISTERALHVNNIKPVEDFLNEQCVNIVQRILKDPHHPITISIHRNKYNNNIIMPRTNTTQYQNSVLQKSLNIIRDGYVNKYTNPRQIETTTAAYQVEIRAKKERKPNSTLYQQQQQPPLSKPQHQPSARSVYSKPKISTALKYTTAKCVNKPKSLVSFP
jgi:hypothetical protein